MSMDVRDMIIAGVVSNCCNAPVMLGNVCFSCDEPCEAESEDGPTDEQQERIAEQAYLAREKDELRAQREEQEIRDAGRGHLLGE